MHHKYTEIKLPIEADNPAIQRHEGLCIKCGQCVRHALGNWRRQAHDLAFSTAKVICSDHRGQCAMSVR